MSETSIIYGFHAVNSRLRSHPEGVREIYLDRERRDARAQDLLKLAEQHGVRVVLSERQRLDGLAGHNKHQGVVAQAMAIAQPRFLEEVLDNLREPALLVVLDGVQDPHNLGACLRVADAFGAHAVIAPKDRAVGLNATARKVASGAAETVPYFTVTNLARTLRELKDEGIWIVGTDMEGSDSLYTAKLDGPMAWVMGAEGQGMRRLTREHCDLLVHIPMCGSVESLNVSVSCGICLYESRRRRQG